MINARKNTTPGITFMKHYYTTSKATNNGFAFNTTGLFLLILVVNLLNTFTTAAQGIIINPRSSMVLNGGVTLVINNGSLKNDGALIPTTSTVKFSGDTDTLTSNVNGSNKTIFHNLSIVKSSYGVALKSAVGVRNVLAVTGGNLYTDSNLTLISDAALTARLDVVPSTSKIIGKANVERYIPSRRAWRLMTAPVTSSNTIFNSWQNKGIYTPGLGTLVTGTNPTGATGNGLDLSYQNNVSLKSWNPATQALVNVLNTHVSASPRNTGSADNTGYFMFVRGDRDPNNTFVPNSNITTLTSIGSLQTGTQVFAASNTANRYALIGNPYASPVDFDKIVRNNVVKRFYVWDPTINALGGYVMMDDLDNDGIYVKSILASNQTKDIQSSQAFFVETKVNGEAAVTFNENSKSGKNNNLAFRPQTSNTTSGTGVGQIRTNLYLLEANNTTIFADGVIAEFNDIYSAGLDRDDAIKFGNVDENLALQRITTSLAAERRPALTINDTVLFKITKIVSRNYQFEFIVDGLQQQDMYGILIDSYLNTNTIVSLAGTTTVNFSVNGNAASYAANRFRLVFRLTAPLPVTITNVAAYQKNTNIAVDWKVANEMNMLKYDVEKSIDGTTFTTVATINVTGTYNAANSYNWLDENAVQGNNFYRIKSYDNNGEVKYSSIVKVTIGQKEGSFSIYPNPITGNVINLQINNQPAGNYHVRLTNNIGQVLYVSSFNNNGGSNSQSLNTGSKLPVGIYQLEIIGQDNNHNTQKVIVE